MRVLSEVRQAHLPGNYELYDEVSNVLGPQICKFCWEEEEARNSSSLDTVWLMVDGWTVVWWLCKDHHKEIGSVASPTRRVLRSQNRVIANPPIGG
jgi:hypothetical protein